MSAYLVYPVGQQNQNDGLDSVTRNLYFDVVTNERSNFASEVTEYAVEQGANITDHVRTSPDEVTLEIVVTNQPISDDPQGNMGAFVGSLPITPKVFTPPLNSSSILSVLSPQGIAGVLAAGGLPQPKPQPTAAQVLQFSSISEDRPSDVKALLLSLKEKGALLHVVTSTIDYDNMVITELSHERTVDTGTAFKGTVTFKRLRIVQTQTTIAPKLARASAPKPKGLRQPISVTVEQKKQSTASYLAKGGWIPSFFKGGE